MRRDFCGQLRAQYQAAKARWEEARAAYEQSILTAFQEVSDALIAREKLGDAGGRSSYDEVLDLNDGSRPRAEGQMPPACRCVQFGRTTVSITWMTPLLAATSVLTTLALSTVTVPSVTLTSRDWPLTVLAFIVFTSAAMTLPGTTW
jgi:hypothetical protein